MIKSQMMDPFYLPRRILFNLIIVFHHIQQQQHYSFSNKVFTGSKNVDEFHICNGKTFLSQELQENPNSSCYKGLLKSDVLYNNIFPQFSQLTPQMALSMFEPSVSVPVRSCVFFFFIWYFQF